MTQLDQQRGEDLERYLDPKVLARIQRLEIRTRLVVEGFISGLHRSPYRGQSVEFAQHREYAPGDDLKHLDWKVYARSDRYYIKQYEEETNLRCMFLLDVSESMRYAGAAGRTGEGLSKFHYAACAAASLALLLLRQQDAAGLTTFDDDLRVSLAPSTNPNTIKSIVNALETAEGTLKAKTSLESVCLKAAEKMGRRGMVCVISDLMAPEEGTIRGLRQLVHRGHDVMVLQVLDEDELSFPFDGQLRFRGMEASGTAVVQARFLRDGYLEAINRFLDKMKQQCIANRILYARYSTADHLGAVLGDFLTARAAMGRTVGKR
jgi:uncharacterized protein (DUF58 family)